MSVSSSNSQRCPEHNRQLHLRLMNLSGRRVGIYRCPIDRCDHWQYAESRGTVRYKELRTQQKSVSPSMVVVTAV